MRVIYQQQYDKISNYYYEKIEMCPPFVINTYVGILVIPKQLIMLDV